MKHFTIYALASLAVLPISVPVTFGVLAARAIRRAVGRRRVRHFVVTVGQGRAPWRQERIEA